MSTVDNTTPTPCILFYLLYYIHIRGIGRIEFCIIA